MNIFTMNELRIELHIPPEKANVCYNSIALEANSGFQHRSEIKLKEFRQGLRILINTKDLSAMRSVVNTYLRWVIMCCSLID